MPSVVSASISSLTFIVPISAAYAAPGAAGHDDRRHDRRHLPDHRHRHQVRRVDAGAELAQLRHADEREDHADQQADEADDRQRVGARLLDVLQHVGLQILRTARGEALHRQRRFTDERDEVDCAAPQLPASLSPTFCRNGVVALRARGTFAGLHGERERDRSRRAPSGRPTSSNRDCVSLRIAIDVDQPRDQAAVPTTQFRRIESDCVRLGACARVRGSRPASAATLRSPTNRR